MNRPAMQTTQSAAKSLALAPGILQRKCACGNHTVAGGECAECGKKKNGLQREATNQSAKGVGFSLPGTPVMQRKLTIGANNDPLEQEADRVADQVLAAPTHPTASGAVPHIQRYTGKATGGADTSPASVDRVLASPGRPLESALQQDMGQRFGHDFSRVRVHSGGAAEQSARDVSANAYTVGHNVVFGAGQFAPGTHEGRQLLAHELTHVVQQSANPTVLQRAENDTVPGCAVLTDTQSDVDAKVNASLAAARATAGKPPAGMAVARGVESDLGSNVIRQPGRSEIEVWTSTLPPTKVLLPAQSATKYAGVTYQLWSQPLFPILNPTMKVNGICVGSDKLGHFFQQGATFRRTDASSGRAAAEEESERSEGGGFGLNWTGVFSNADQEANRQGGRFYNDLIAFPTMTFSIARYISARWSEVDNPNFYEGSVGQQVWANTLTGYWTGQSLATAAKFSEIWLGELNATIAGKVTGKFSVGGRNLGKISNGVITYNTTTVKGESQTGIKTSPSPISGIHIDFDWTLDSDSGKGFLDSKGERHMIGRWGREASNSNGGSWEIKHT